MPTQLLLVPSVAAGAGGVFDPAVIVTAVTAVIGAVLLVRWTRTRSGAEASPGHRAEAAPMFGTLLATQPKRDLRGMLGSAAGSIVAHVVVIAALVWATMAVGTELVAEEEVTFIELPPEEIPPPPPPPPPVNIEEQVAPIDIAKGFQTLSIPDIVPPEIPPPQFGITIREEDFSGMGREGGRADGREGGPPVDDLSVAPVFTPMTVRPELLNSDEVRRALVRLYPPLLRDAGIGGRTLLWFFIDETGKVVKTQLKETSGYDALDETAMRVADVMRFSPALNRDKKVQVWLEIPIIFTAQ